MIHGCLVLWDEDEKDMKSRIDSLNVRFDLKLSTRAFLEFDVEIS